MQGKSIVIFPIDEDLRFLKKIANNISSNNGFIKIKLSNNDNSHHKAISIIKSLDDKALMIFLGHGVTRALHGCKFRAQYMQHPQRYSFQERYGYFINKSNINILKNKKVFCLACESDSLGRIAIDAGAKLFIGFSVVEFDEISTLMEGQNPRKEVAAKTKYALRNAITNSINIAIRNKLSALQFLSILKISLNKECDKLIIDFKNNPGFGKYYKTSANCLYNIKSGIHLFGNGSLPLIE